MYPFSQHFRPALRPFLALLSSLLLPVMLPAAPTHLVDESPVSVTPVAPGTVLVDFGRVAFGNLRVTAPDGTPVTATVHFGENLVDGRVDRQPPGTVRYNLTTVDLPAGATVVAAPPADVRNTWTPGQTDPGAMNMLSSLPPPAVLTPPEWGVVLPFRWAEIEGWPGEFTADHIVRQAGYASTWDDEAAAFESSDEMLNRIWELCRYTIKATTFAGVYVDGDRERIPYEADAYLNQLSHYTTDTDVQMARDTLDHLMIHGTWPSEWAPHLIFMVHADWMRTGDTAWLAERYDALKSKLLDDRAGPDELVRSNAEQVRKTDIVDWPVAERDGYVFTPINTVVNAFQLRSLTLMAELADALGRSAEATRYRDREATGRAAFQETLFDVSAGLYRDGIDTDHHSLHANLFPLAFGLVPPEHRDHVARWLADRGMACSVYAAQYLLEGLFRQGLAEEALALITAPNDRSWRHMVESGATLTWEAWDLRYKPNQDWNHAWGAAPANLLPRFVLGVEALAPGEGQLAVTPRPGGLRFARGRVPTNHGPVMVDWIQDDAFTLRLALPDDVTARLSLPAPADSTGVTIDGSPVAAARRGDRWEVADPVSGQATIVVR